MSQSKLESLPNEIIIEIFEKYMNGADVLTAFYGQLNRRFTTLVEGCRRFRLNFIRCSKSGLRAFLDHLPMHTDKIEEIAISDEDAPGQIYTFLSAFPSLGVFGQLRSFYFHCDSANTDSNLVEEALRSLLHTRVERLSMIIQGSRGAFLWGTVISDLLLLLQTLKRVCIISDYLVYIDWKRLSRNGPSPIECLVLSGVDFRREQFRSLAQWVPDLKHLGLRISDSQTFRLFGAICDSKMQITPFSKLQTLRWRLIDKHPVTISFLEPYLNAMPVLNRLEIIAEELSMTSDEWKVFLTKSSPSLTSVIALQSSFVPSKNDAFGVLDFLRDVIPISKEFDYKQNLPTIPVYPRCFLKYYHANFDPLAFHTSALRCAIVPKCYIGDKYHYKLDSITNLVLSVDMNRDSYEYYYFSNIKLLLVESLDESLLEWMRTSVNCSSILELCLVMSTFDDQQLGSLLQLLPNVWSLHITFDLLRKCADALKGMTTSVSCLNLTPIEHSFTEEDMLTISSLFPCLKHLKIYTSNYKNILLLKTYFSHLISVTFKQSQATFYLLKSWKRLQKYQLQMKPTVFNQDKMILITVWIDEVVNEELQSIEDSVSEIEDKQEEPKQEKKKTCSLS